MPNCEICGQPMPAGEEMFKYHGYSGPCPKAIADSPQKAVIDTEQAGHVPSQVSKEILK